MTHPLYRQRRIVLSRLSEMVRCGKSFTDKVMQQRSRCIAGRATTCQKAHHEDHPEIHTACYQGLLAVYNRDEEGALLLEAADKGVMNAARYHHHEPVHVFHEGWKQNRKSGTSTCYPSGLPMESLYTRPAPNQLCLLPSAAALNKHHFYGVEYGVLPVNLQSNAI